LILLADEPTGNLDPATSVGIMRILDRINRTGTTVVMATHDHAIVDAMRRRVVQLERGRVVRDQSRGAYEQRTVVEPAASAEVASAEPEQSRAELELAAAEAELAELPIDEGYPNGTDDSQDAPEPTDGAGEESADSPPEDDGTPETDDS
jgi:ABC-type methionine transport system ATPase subunit